MFTGRHCTLAHSMMQETFFTTCTAAHGQPLGTPSRAQRNGKATLVPPRLASAELGRHIWTSFSAAALKTTLEILNGTDPATYPRYLSFLAKNPLYQDWIKSAQDRDSTLAAKQHSWSASRRK